MLLTYGKNIFTANWFVDFPKFFDKKRYFLKIINL